MTFDELYRLNYKDIYRFIFRMIGSAEDAKDATQEVFVKLYGYMNEGKKPDNPRAWLYKVATNNCLNFLKRNKNYLRIMEENLIPVENKENIEENIIKDRRVRMVKKAIVRLPEKDRAILMLYQDNLSYTEIARVMNMKKNSVGKALSRAIDKLCKDRLLVNVL